MRRPYEPRIEVDADGNFSVNDPEPVRGPDGYAAFQGVPNPNETISRMLMESLKEATPAPRTVNPARIPEHLRRYLKR